MKALGQTGLDFIASKYKELKELVSKKADKSEIITKEERHQLELDRKGYSAITLQDLESKLKSSGDYVLRYPKAKHLVMFDFVQEVRDGKITPPEDTQVPYTYSLQSWLLKDESNHMYVVCDENMKPFTLDYLAKADKTSQIQCLVYNVILGGIESYFSASRVLTATTEYFVKQEDGKGLSTNDYDNTAKSKVDAIPSNPEYTDTTYDLSKYAEKADISRCKTKGYDTSSTWKSLSTERDLEDWIGDFDKRTRELRDSGGGELKTWVFGQNLQCVATKMGRLVVIFFNGQDFYNWGRRPTLPSDFRPAFDYFRNASSLSSGEKELAFNCGSGTFVSILSDGTIRLLAYERDSSSIDAFAANIVYFTD